MNARSLLLSLAVAGTALAVSAPTPVAADALVDYRGSAFARTSGNACREAAPTANGLSYGKTGARNASAKPVSVWCPIARRNSTPVGAVEQADTSLAAAYVPVTKLDRLSLDVRFTPDTAGTSCTAYGRMAGPLGGVFFSSTLTTCAKNATDCAGAERTQTLTWTDPFGGAYPLINLGVRCELQKNAGIIGSVASFSTDAVPAPRPAR